jgi:HK97 family phage portal protein
MSFLKSLFTKFGTRQSANGNPTTKSWASAWLTAREDTLAGHSFLTSAYQQSSWVYACITTLAESVSAIPFRFVSGNNSEPIQNPKSEIENLFNNPHPQLDRFQFWELIVIWLCLRGEAFIYPIPNSIGNRQSAIANLLILCPDHLHEIILNGQLAGWRYTASGISAFSFGDSALAHSSFGSILLPEELIHIKTPNPFNFWRGLSPLTVAWLSAQTDYAAAQFMKGLMFNNADTGLIVTTDAQLSPEQREVIEAALRNRKRSAGTPDKPVFLGGGVKIEKPSISAVDLQFLENRKFNRQEICAIFKVPQELIGFTEDANRSVSDAMRLNFMENRVAPLCRRLEAAMQPLIDQLNPGGRGSTRAVRGEFHIKSTPIMQSAQRARFETATKLFSMGIPLNIINKNLDLGLPKLPHGDKVYLPTKLQEIGSSGTDDPGREEPQQQDDPADRCLRLLPLLNLNGNHRRFS